MLHHTMPRGSGFYEENFGILFFEQLNMYVFGILEYLYVVVPHTHIHTHTHTHDNITTFTCTLTPKSHSLTAPCVFTSMFEGLISAVWDQYEQGI